MISLQTAALLVLAASGSVQAQKIPQKPTPTGEAACAAISSMQAKYKAEYAASHPNATYTPMMTAPVALATECLYSVPINRKLALQQLNGIQRYVQYQSTLGFIKNPPKEDSFQAPRGIDIVAEINSLAMKIKSKEVTKEYDFELKLRNLFASANDGHLTATLGGLLAIQFTAPFDLVSVSKDGLSLPEVYQAAINAQGILEPVGSPVVSIDGVNVTTYLNQIADGTGLQSPDARYNGLFPSRGLGGRVISDGFWRHRRRYPGKDGFSISFADGTQREYNYHATISGNFKDVKDAKSFYDVFVKGGQLIGPSKNARCDANSEEGSFSHRMAKLKMARRQNVWKMEKYAGEREDAIEPTHQDSGKAFAGYFLKKSNTAVIQMMSFSPECWTDVASTIFSVRRFLAECRKRGATKLIIDLTNNPGGYIMLGYDLFLQLFPHTLPYSGQRLRENAGALIKARAFSGLTMEKLTANTNRSDYYSATASNWAYALNLDEEYKAFKNVDQFIGPVKANGDEFSAIWRFNMTQKPYSLGVLPYNSMPGLIPAFEPKNIVLLTDGQCSSTCSTFSEFMQTQKGVKSVAVGGIPLPRRGMPLVGGVRGSQIMSYKTLLASSQAVDKVNPTSDKEEQSNRNRNLPQELPLPMSGNINYMDNVRKGEKVPLQFVEEPATCRMFYTKRTIARIEALWESVHEAAFESGKGCAFGSLKG